MTQLVWDAIGEKFYETGVDHGVLYLPDSQGAYVNGVAWNGLTSVKETHTGGEANAKFADNIKYLNLYSSEDFGATLDAFTYPDEFGQFDGLGTPSPGIRIGQQSRKSFGLSYRTKFGNDASGDDFGYKLHLVYGCSASPSEKSYNTINDKPEAIIFSWKLTTSPVAVTGFKPTSILTINSSKVSASALASLEQILYGSGGVNPVLPLPGAVLALFTGTVTAVTPTQPAFNQSTNTVTIPTVAGITYYINGVSVASGARVLTANTTVVARPNNGYVLTAGVDDDWFYTFV